MSAPDSVFSSIRRYIEGSGYEVVMLSDGSRSAFPMDSGDAIKAVERAERYEAVLRYIAEYGMTGTEQTLHIDFQGKAREALGA